MKIFSDQGKRVLRRVSLLTVICVLGLAALRFIFLTVANTGITHRIRGEVSSPSGNKILTVYDSYGIFGFQGSTTVFNLRTKGDPIRFMRNSYLTGQRLVRPADIALVGGSFFPYDIVWSDENHLQIKASHLPGYRYQWAKYDSSDVEMFEKHESQWTDVAVSYGLIGKMPGKDEIRIGASRE